jgi:hypothetical protein
MPNWNNTSLVVEGDPAEVQRFIEGIKDSKIIESYYPCPDELNILSGHMAEDNPEYAQWVAKTEENIVKYGVPNWYEWQYQYWGTKWGDVRTEIDEPFTQENGKAQCLIQFETAWGPADGAWIHISKMFPALTFEFYYTEEAGFFEGYHIARNGEWVFEAQYEPCENPFDCDEQEEEYEKWEEAQRGKIETEWMAWKEKV